MMGTDPQLYYILIQAPREPKQERRHQYVERIPSEM